MDARWKHSGMTYCTILRNGSHFLESAEHYWFPNVKNYNFFVLISYNVKDEETTKLEKEFADKYENLKIFNLIPAEPNQAKIVKPLLIEEIKDIKTNIAL